MKKSSKSYLKSLLVRLTAWLVLVCLVVSFAGVPLPAGAKKDRSVPFPCQDRACGCMSAADCKHGCCCFSDDQRREWARQHGLDPETLVDEPKESASVVPNSTADDDTACCSKDPACPCCCCQQHQIKPTQATVDVADAEDDSDVILVWQARRCQGQGEWWLTLTLVMPPPRQEYRLADNLVEFLIEAPVLFPTAPSDEPDEPVCWV